MLDKGAGERRGQAGKGDHAGGLEGDEGDGNATGMIIKWQGRWPRKGPGGEGALIRCT